MKNASVVILSEYPNRSQLFLQDPKSDLFVLLKEKIYPLHKGFLEHVEYFKNPALAQEKVHVLVEHIDVSYHLRRPDGLRQCLDTFTVGRSNMKGTGTSTT